MQNNLTSFYTPAAFYLLRAPALPAQIFFQLTTPLPTLDTSDDHTLKNNAYEQAKRHCYQTLQSLLDRPGIEQALAVASFSLLEGLDRVADENFSKRAEHTFSRLLRYLVRMCSRPTPFGLFSAVSMGDFAQWSDACLMTPIIARSSTRPDMHWLFSIIQHIEQKPEIVSQLRVTNNPTLHLNGGRVQLANADIYGQNDSRSISIRATRPVVYVLTHAQEPVLYSDLRTQLRETFAHASHEQIDQLLWQLWENHFLICDLRPPFTHKAPAHYLWERLTPLQGTEAVCSVLHSLIEKCVRFDQVERNRSRSLLSAMAREQEQLVLTQNHQQPQLQIDALLHTRTKHLQREIGLAAAQAAQTLLRLSRLPHGLSHLQQYMYAFLEQYGPDQEVALLDLLSPEAGLDAPPTYQHPPRTYPLRQYEAGYDRSRYDALLYRLVLQAVNERQIEIELTEEMLQELEQWSPKLDDAPLSLEIFLQIHAASLSDLDHGKWKAVVGPNCGAPAGGRSFGRFSSLFDTGEIAALQDFTHQEEARSPDTIFAELSYLPLQARSANVVTSHPLLRDYEIVVGVTPSVPADHVIQLDDLFVGVRNQRFYVRSQRLRKEVLICQSHMLNPMSGPNVCRFLLEIGRSESVILSPFDWGALASQPFLPRIVQKQVVLRPAQWNLTRTIIAPTGIGTEPERWFAGLQQWRQTWRVPRYVYLTTADNRLLLDLEHPALTEELRGEVAKIAGGNCLKLEELLPDFDHLWLKDEHGDAYFSEIAVPLLRSKETSSGSTNDKIKAHIYPRAVLPHERLALPGSDWVYLKLYAAYKQHDELIAGPLREIVQTLQQQEIIDQWFYIRYCDSAPHLRVRFHLCNRETYQSTIEKVFTWSQQLIQRDRIRSFSMHTYEREVERYGGPEGMPLMEQIFTINSTINAEILAARQAKHSALDPLSLAVFTLDRFFAHCGFNLWERLDWTRTYIQKQEVGKKFHEQKQQLCDLLEPWQHTHNDALLEQREILCQVFVSHQDRLHALFASLRDLACADKLWISPDICLQSLAHMHLNRLMQLDRQEETRIYTYWRQSLESITLRPTYKNIPKTGKEH